MSDEQPDRFAARDSITIVRERVEAQRTQIEAEIKEFEAEIRRLESEISSRRFALEQIDVLTGQQMGGMSGQPLHSIGKRLLQNAKSQRVRASVSQGSAPVTKRQAVKKKPRTKKASRKSPRKA